MNEPARVTGTDELEEEAQPETGASAGTEVTDQEEDEMEVAETKPIRPPIEEEAPASIIKTATKPQKKGTPIIKVAMRCLVGDVRDRNEDSSLIFQSEAGGHYKLMPFGLYLVADGMGGHANGHRASKLASRVAGHHIINHIYLPLLYHESGPNQTPIQEVLVEAVQAANAAIYAEDPESDSGTTLTIALLLGKRLYIAHVGDSRLYLYADDELMHLTEDHSLVQRLQDVGQITAEEAPYYQYRHVLLRALGQAEEVEVDTVMRSLPESGKLLLCTDGLCGFVPDPKIQEIIAQEGDVQELVDELATAAIDAGGYDNITVVVVDFRFNAVALR